METVRVIKAGLYTSIQDNGRLAYTHYGVPQAGVMDRFSAAKANLLVNNSHNEAVLEITMLGPTLFFEGRVRFAISGAHFEVWLNGEQLDNDKAYTAIQGDTLQFKKIHKGFRAYLAFYGGIQAPIVLESKSHFKNITQQFKLADGDKLYVEHYTKNKTEYARVSFRESNLFTDTIPVYKGPEYDCMSSQLQNKIANLLFTIDQNSNRMAVRFTEKLPNNLKGILTGPVIPGTVQLTPYGDILVLMRDAQVTGGYPRILQVSEDGMDRLSQKRPGERVNLSISEAHLM